MIHRIGSLTYVHIGASFPHYGRAALLLARETSGLQPRIIASARTRRQVGKQTEFIAIEDFYDGSAFGNARSYLSASETFRSGFWFAALERFFVLNQFMQHAKERYLLHAELDQLLFRTDLLAESLLEQSNASCFVPFHSQDRAIASVFFVRDRSGLNALERFATSGRLFRNEMELLAAFASEVPNQIGALPTLRSLTDEDTAVVPTLSPESTRGIADAAELGQWVGGIDPRNLPLGTPLRNHYSEPHREAVLRRASLALHDDASLFIDLDGERYRLFNLHLHSKIHQSLRSKRLLRQLIDWANDVEDRRLPRGRRIKFAHRAAFARQTLSRLRDDPNKVARHVRRRFQKLTGMRPSSAPFISGDTFRSIADHVWDETTGNSVDLKSIRGGDIVFCVSTDTETLVRSLPDMQNQRIVLLVGNAYVNHDADAAGFLRHPRIGNAWAQNMVEDVPGVSPMPIGLENAWRATHGVTSAFERLRALSVRKNARIMCAFSVSTNPEIRIKAMERLSASATVDVYSAISPDRHRKTLAEYQFVASPPGNGIDCHRTWEAMYLRTIPIVLRSHAMEYFHRLGMPLWIVDVYSEATTLSADELEAKYLTMEHRFDHEALYFPFWEREIRRAARHWKGRSAT